MKKEEEKTVFEVWTIRERRPRRLQVSSYKVVDISEEAAYEQVKARIGRNEEIAKLKAKVAELKAELQRRQTKKAGS